MAFPLKSGTDSKSNTLGSMNRQNVIQETNKKRTLLQDSSWIKNRPEEDEDKIKDANYGKNILNKYKSQEDLDRASEEDKKPIHNRFKSDDALDRISLRNTSEIGNKSATLERMPMSGQDAALKSRQSWAPSNKTTTTTTTTTDESKRKSWGPASRSTTTTTITTTTEANQAVPGKPEGQKITIYSSDTKATDKPRTTFVDSTRSRTEEKPKLPPRSPTDAKPAYPAKPVFTESAERRSAVERKQRSQDLNNLIEVSTTKVVSRKGSQDLDDLIDVSKAKSVSSKGSQDQLDSFIEISDSAKSPRKREDELNSYIEVKKPEPKTGTSDFDNLIRIKNTTANTNKGNTDLDDLIAITGEQNKREANPPVNSTNTTSRSSTATTTYNVTNESDAPTRRSATTRTYNIAGDSSELPNRLSTTTTYKVTDDSYNPPSNRSSTTTTYRDLRNGPNTPSNVTVTQETWKSSTNSNGQIIPSNSIKTVYSTSDRTVIEKDLCTYCRKPLGIDAKMILKDLSICCHATCFKCEACSGSLGGLRAGDSMWIYKQKIHCEPCYFNTREKWII
ncbi:sciellin [Gastrophryne carolinensis]